MNNENMSLSVIILTYNEEKHIVRCMNSVKSFASNIIVVDSYSSDETVTLAKKFGAIVYQNTWPNNHSKQVNWALENCHINTKWVMRLDADEIISHELADEIKNELSAVEVSEDESQQFLKKARNHKLIWYGMFTHHQAMFYKLDIVKKNSLKYNLQYEIAADYAFTANYLQYCKSFLYLDIVFCGFKQGGVSSVNTDKTALELHDIKTNIMGLHKIQIFFILTVQKVLNFIRKRFAGLYNLLRFKNV